MTYDELAEEFARIAAVVSQVRCADCTFRARWPAPGLFLVEALFEPDSPPSALHCDFMCLVQAGWSAARIVQACFQAALGVREERLRRTFTYAGEPVSLPLQPGDASRLACGKTEKSDSGVTQERHRCDNCLSTLSDEQLCSIRDYDERVEAGCVVPSGECPFCGALAYPMCRDGAPIAPFAKSD